VPGGHVVRDANGQALAHICSRKNEAEALRTKMLTKDEARRIATDVARLPELLGRASEGRRAEHRHATAVRIGAGISLLIEPPAFGSGAWEWIPKLPGFGPCSLAKAW
jgi:hypothetical protein